MWNNSPYLRLLMTRTLPATCRNYSSRPARETHYDILNLPRNCTNKDIKNAFIKLSKQYHPDRNKSKESQERFVKISTAYSVLSKPDARRNYDLGLPKFHHYHPGSTGFKYHEVPAAKNPWDDPYFYVNRNKSKDTFYRNQPYYGIPGVQKLPNKVVATICLLIASVGVLLQVMAIRRDDLLRKSNEAAAELQRVRNKANVNGHEMQVQLLEQKFREDGIIRNDK